MYKNNKLLTTVLFTIAVTAFLGFAFQNKNNEFQKNGIKIYELNGSPEFGEAALILKSPQAGTTLMEGKNTFNFEVSNYQLGAQTPDAEQNMCANSAKGQHIHFIMDNNPYYASYSTNVDWEMKPGHHVLVAFLSRSYHESLKDKKAYVLHEFSVGSGVKDNFDETAPHIFFSRPKGEYIGEKETTKLMLDFYLLNCHLSPGGYKVRATINGNEFMLTKWAPYIIEGLALGQVKVKLELLDKKGNLVKSPFNGAERTVMLKHEPLRN